MKIASADITMASQHYLLQRDEKSESLRFWTNGAARAASSPLQQVVADMRRDIIDISRQAKEKFQQQLRDLEDVPEAGLLPAAELDDIDKQKIQLIQDFIEAVTGKKIKIVVPDSRLKLARCDHKDLPAIGGRAAAGQGADRAGWGLAYNSRELHSEQEQTTFAAGGVIKTADGREIEFSLAVSMSRSFLSQRDISIRAGDAAIDPLVINFDAPAAALTQTKFSFDLDSDGSAEQVSFVNSGSGFLALDGNNDGKINDGRELFGPQSGNGFSELAQYDSDGNNWIDENDPIYERLRIWTKDSQGNDQLFALGQKGIGAIYLGNINTSFSIKDPANQLQGQVQRSGVFLRENGVAGSIQQVDLAV